MSQVDVLILMGSDSDLDIMQTAADTLTKFGVSHRMHVSSAHRAPDKTSKLASTAMEKGVKVIIAAAGYAAHLAGVVAAHTILPVIGVPLPGSALNGFDSLLSTVQMPGGIPVATVTIGKAGAKNAAILATQILALQNPKLQESLEKDRAFMRNTIETKDSELNR